MKKYLALFSILTGMLSAAAAPYRLNFEDQNTTQWVPFKKGEPIVISGENPAEGKYSLVILPAGMKQSKSTMVPISPDLSYNIEAKIRAVSGSRVRMSVVESDGRKEWLKGTTFFVGETRSTNWVHIQNVWKAKNPAARFITIQFDGGDGFADDISMEEARPVQKVSDMKKNLVLNWKNAAGNAAIAADGTIRLQNGSVEAVIPVDKAKAYCLTTENIGAVGQRVLYHVTEYDKNDTPLTKEPILFGKINTNGVKGSHIVCFSTGPVTEKIRISIRSVGDVSFPKTVLAECKKAPSNLKFNVLPDSNYYYPGENGRADIAVYNIGKKMERFALLIRLLNEDTNECFVPDISYMDYGGKVAAANWLRAGVFLPLANLTPGSWKLQIHMLVNGNIVDYQEHRFGKAPFPKEELTRENVSTRKEPIFFMMLSQWPDTEMLRNFRARGFDVVEQDFTWGEIEPTQGVYNWEIIDRTLKLTENSGIKSAIKIQCWDLPADLKQRMVSSRGEAGDCPPNRGESMKRLTALWKAVAQRYANHPQVIWYVPTVGLNDGPQHGSFTRCHSVKQCFDYSPENAAEWADYLKKRFSLEEVCEFYGKNFSSWEEVPLPSDEIKYDPEKDPYLPKNVFDYFMEYNAEGITKALTGIWRAIRSVDTKTPIIWKVGGNYQERVPKGFEYEKLLQTCKELDVIFTSTGTPSQTGEPIKIEFARNILPDKVMVGEVGAEGEMFPAPPLCTSRCFYLTMRYDMQIMGFCHYPVDIPPDLWGHIKNMQAEVRGFSRYSGNLRIWADSSVRTYSQRMVDLITSRTSTLRANMQWVENLNLPFAHLYERTLDNLQKTDVLLDPGSPFFPEDVLKKLLAFVNDGGTLLLTKTSGIYQKSPEIAELRKKAVNGTVSLGAGKIFFLSDEKSLAAAAEKLQLLPPVTWQGNIPIHFSIMENAKGDKKLLLFNPTDKNAAGTVSCNGILADFTPTIQNVKLDAASLKLIDLKRK